MKSRLPASSFYGLIVFGVLAGVGLAAFGAWLYLEAGDRVPTGRRIWADLGASFVVPVAVMVGGTFGGLAGLAAAVISEKWSRK